MLKRFFNCYITLLFCAATLLAQTIQAQISGTVKDANTKQVIPFANIILGNNLGIIADINGTYSIPSEYTPLQITISSMGYQTLHLNPSSLILNPNIELQPMLYQLDEVKVRPSKNPALSIMEQVVANAPKNNPNNYPSFSCILYHKLVFDFDTYEKTNTDQQINNKPENTSYLMLMESVSEKKHLKKGKDKEIVISGRVSGLKTPIIASLSAQLQPFSFYEPTVQLLDFAYLNPASEAGLKNYLFTLSDTLLDAKGDTIFYLTYKPRPNKNIRGLTGSFHIHANTNAIQTVTSQTIGGEGGLTLSINQNYQQHTSGLWFPHQLESTLHIAAKSASPSIPRPLIGKGKSYVTAINTNPQFNPRDFDNVQFEDISRANDSLIMISYRNEPLTLKDSVTYYKLDSIGKQKHLDAMVNMQLSMIKGYVPMGVLQLQLNKLLDYNHFEGLRLGLGLYTSPKLSKNFTTGGYFAYGFKDKNWKYGTSLDITPLKNKENKIILAYKDDVNSTGSVTFIDGINQRSAEAYGRFTTKTMDLNKEATLGTEFRWLYYLKTGVYYKQGRTEPTEVYRFSNTSTITPAFDYSQIEIKTKWAYKETFSNTAIGRISNGTAWPLLWVNGTWGETTNANQLNDSYQRIDIQTEQTIRYASTMFSRIRLLGGQLFGTTNPSLLYSALGTHSNFDLFVPNKFATMRPNEFASSKYAACFLAHTIPLFLNSHKTFKPQLEFDTNMAIGTAPSGNTSLEKGYYESGVYIKKLLTHSIIQYGLSAHYRYGAYALPKQIDNWAFKLGVEFMF